MFKKETWQCFAGGRVVQEDGLPSIKAAASSDNFTAACKAAAAADVTVVMLGLAFEKFCVGAGDTTTVCEGESHDREVIELARGQASMVHALRTAIGPEKRLVAVLIHGGTIAFTNETTDALDAVLDAWYPGFGGGEAIAAALLGDVSPAGRSPQTWYSQTADLPPRGYMGLYPNSSAGSPHGVTYRHYRGPRVRWPFGYGLSYARFNYSQMKLDKASGVGYQPCDSITVTVTVTNTGAFDSDEVVQVYVKQPAATVPVPQVRLGAFLRVHIPAGGSEVVSLVVKPDAHSVVTSDEGGEAIYLASADQRVEQGAFELHVGGGQPDYFEGSLMIKAPVVADAPLSSCDAH